MRRFSLLVLSLMVAAIVQVSAGGAPESAAAGAADQLMTPAGQYPIVKPGSQVTMTAFNSTRGKADDFENNEFTKWLENKTGVKLKFTVAPESDARTKLNLLLSSGDYPDLVFLQLNIGDMAIYGAQGVLQPIEKHVDKYGVYVKKLFEEYPVARGLVTAPDGHMYAMPQVNECYHCKYNGRLWMNHPWLQKLGLKVPETTEEYYEVLKAFKTRDPNGNGKADEVPLAGTTTEMDRFHWYFMGSFLPYPYQRMTAGKDGKIDVPFNKAEYRDGLRYLARLYSEGLMLKESFTITQQAIRQIGEHPDAPLIGSAPGHGAEGFTQKAGPSGRWYHYIPIPPLKGPKGVRQAFYRGQLEGIVPGYFITSKNKYPEIAVRLGDIFYEKEAMLLAYIGRQGKEWDWAKPGEVGLNGQPALYKLLVTYGAQEKNVSWDQANHSYRNAAFRLGEAATGLDEILSYIKKPEVSRVPEMARLGAFNEAMKYYVSKNYYDPYKVPEEMIVPPLVYDQKTATEVGDLEAAILSHVDESMARFITGDLSLDKDWDSYVSQIDKMGLKRLIELRQKAYETKYKAK